MKATWKDPDVLLSFPSLWRGIVALDGDHGIVEKLADLRVFGPALEEGPAGLGRNPEDVFGQVLVAVFRVSALFLFQCGVFFLEGVGDVLEENKAEDNVLGIPRRRGCRAACLPWPRASPRSQARCRWWIFPFQF